MREKNSPDTQDNDAEKFESTVEKVKPRYIEPVSRGFRVLDFFVLIICLSGIFFFIYLFRNDLFKTINLQNIQSVGTVVSRSNVVQRRVSDRILWDRLVKESSIYLGDIIRVAELSSAVLELEGQQINLNENTLIRIQRSPDGESLLIELTEGSISISTSDEGGNIQLNLMGQVVETTSGSVLNLSADNGGVQIQVNEGAAVITGRDGESRAMSTGSMIAIDAEGTEKHEPAVVVMSPRSSARFLNNSKQPLPVSFQWSRINLEQDDRLRLEISEDSNFERINHSLNGLVDSSHPSLDAGIWYWRILLNEDALSSGRFTVVQASAPDLVSPINDSSILYQKDSPSVSFQWSEVSEASHYYLEVSLLSDFLNSHITQETSATSYNASAMGQGTWYWRVKPVFSSGFDGETSFSEISRFRVEQSVLKTEEEIVLPAPPPSPLELRLLSPDDGASITGLTALRSPTTFRWDSDRDAASSRFVLSQNSEPLSQPAIEINNPGRTLQVNRIDTGTWYWTVEATSVEGLVSSLPPQRIQVLSIPRLPAPVNLRPPSGHHIEIESIRTQRAINFSWQPVTGANAYIFTLFEQTANGRRQIIRTSPQNVPRWTLDDLNVLANGTFFWQVEAVNVNQNGVIEQSGAAGENFFIVEFPLPEVEVRRPGVLYGQ